MPAAIKTPVRTANTVFLNPRSRKLAPRVPVQAPVPGRGMPTKRARAMTRPYLPKRPEESFLPAASPLS